MPSPKRSSTPSSALTKMDLDRHGHNAATTTTSHNDEEEVDRTNDDADEDETYFDP